MRGQLAHARPSISRSRFGLLHSAAAARRRLASPAATAVFSDCETDRGGEGDNGDLLTAGRRKTKSTIRLSRLMRQLGS